jgi:hypothetical protein
MKELNMDLMKEFYKSEKRMHIFSELKRTTYTLVPVYLIVLNVVVGIEDY